MKHRYLLAVLLLLAMTAFTAGCKGEYFFSFKVEQSLSDGKGEWIMENDDYLFVPDGLGMQDANAACPKRFSGDFTATFLFRLNIDGAHRHTFGIAFSDYTFYSSPTNSLEIEFFNVHDASPTYTISEEAYGIGSKSHHPVADVPDFDLDGLNEIVVEKVGDTITVYHDETLWCTFTLEKYDSRWFGPNLFIYNIDAQSTSYGLAFESLEVSYNGSTSNTEVNL